MYYGFTSQIKLNLLPFNFLDGITLLFFGATIILLLIFVFSFNAREVNSKKIHQRDIVFLVVFRNEGSKLINQIEAFLKSKNSLRHRVYWIDDFSDNIPDGMEELISSNPNYHLYRRVNGEQGKKYALEYGLNLANSQWVFLLDADSIPQRNILESESFQIGLDWKMVLIPLSPKKSSGFISNFFDLDFISLHFTGLCSSRMNKPLLSNGAALLINREAYLKSMHIRTDFDIPSGDDLFAMFAIKRLYGASSIGCSKSIGKVTVSFPESFSDLWSQRLRWIGKTPQIRDNWFQFISWLVLFCWILIYPLALYSFINYDFLILRMLIVFLMTIFLYLAMACSFVKRRDLIWFILPSIFFYPFYLSALVLTSIFQKKSWI